MSNDVPPTLVLPPFRNNLGLSSISRKVPLLRTNHACVIVMILLHKMWKEFPLRIFFFVKVPYEGNEPTFYRNQ